VFTGWEDAPLAAEGRIEAQNAGKLLKLHGIEVRNKRSCQRPRKKTVRF
jgi:bisphosphoglycerate-dependent phosphoglycerate mutase